jgi:hypothetical protein
MSRDNSMPPDEPGREGPSESTVRALLLRLLRLVAVEVARSFWEPGNPSSPPGTSTPERTADGNDPAGPAGDLP